jgi:hypothetical protein
MHASHLRAATLLVALLITGTTSLAAQGGRSRDANRGAPPPASSPAFSMPTVNQMKERANVANLLVDKRKKVGLDGAALDSMKALSAAIDARNAPHLEVYDSLRTRMRAAMNGGGAGPSGAPAGGAAGGPGAGAGGGPGGGRGGMGGMGEAVRAMDTGRQADVALVLALVPADKQEEAKKLIADQEEDFKKSMGGGRGGAPPAGGRPRP